MTLAQSPSVEAGPRRSKQLNPLRLTPPLLARWRMDDVRFEPDSSFILPAAAAELAQLAEAFDRLENPSLLVFGHADPVGGDEYNKTLAGRRAQALYAVLVRDADLWEALYRHPLGGDNWQGFATRRMRDALGPSAPGTRKELFLAYMDAICARASGEKFQVGPGDFLAQGADPGGKGDYQGCGAFNPVRVLSTVEEEDSSHDARDRDNAVNRRVLVFLFRSGFSIQPNQWPCPRVGESSDGCRKLFWPDAELRRHPRGRRRESARDKNTFACAFYDAMARFSPSEAVRGTLELRLLDRAQKPIEHAPYRVTVGSQESRVGIAGAGGQLCEEALPAGSEALIEWGFQGQSEPFPFHKTVRLDFDR